MKHDVQVQVTREEYRFFLKTYLTIAAGLLAFYAAQSLNSAPSPKAMAEIEDETAVVRVAQKEKRNPGRTEARMNHIVEKGLVTLIKRS